MTSSKPRKILYILHSYFNKAGTEQHTKDLMLGLDQEFNTACLAPQRNEIHFIENSEIKNSYQAQAVPWPVTPLNAAQSEKILNDTLQRYNPDIIHLQHFFNWPLSTLEIIGSSGKTCIISFHDYYAITPYFTGEGDSLAATDSPEISRQFFQADITNYLKKRQQYIDQQLKRFALLICPSHSLANDLKKIFKYDYRVIEHGIAASPRIPKSEREGVLRFGFLGSLLPQKGWQQLLAAFRIIQPNYKNTELHFFGNSDQVLPQDKLSETRIFFHGAYQQEDIAKICSMIDVAFIPSVFPETFCLVLSELWQQGVPVAVSNIGALKERVQDGINGRIFKAGDVSEIAKVLTWFIENDTWKNWNTPRVRTLDEMIEEYKGIYINL